MRRFIYCYLVFLLIGIFSSKLEAQTFSYSYDDAGNRTARLLISSKPATIETTENDEILSDIDIAEKSSIEKENELNGSSIISLYPNPTSRYVNISVENPAFEAYCKLIVCDIKGAIIQTKTFQDEEVAVDLSDYPTGTYLFNVYVNNEMKQWKVTKE